jgi:hypothetical protein
MESIVPSKRQKPSVMKPTPCELKVGAPSCRVTAYVFLTQEGSP